MGARFCVGRYVDARGSMQGRDPEVSASGGKGDVSENSAAMAAGDERVSYMPGDEYLTPPKDCSSYPGG